MGLRIIGGEYRRRQLKTPPGRTTRPYTDRVRQIVFDRIGGRCEDARVADIFAGVGTMGLEALSRGATSCVFFEGDVKVHEALSANVSLIAPSKETVCWKTNIHRTSFRPNGGEACLPYDLIFLDPPYDQCPLLQPSEVLGKALKRLARPAVSAEDAIVILRTPQRFQFTDSPSWGIANHWPISTMNLWVLSKAASDSADSGDASGETTT